MLSETDLGNMDLRAAFDFAIMGEEDAHIRYDRCSRLLSADSAGAARVFATLSAVERRHRDDLAARREVLFRDGVPRIEVSIIDDGPESPGFDDNDLPTTAIEALDVAFAAETRATRFYERLAAMATDPEVRAFFDGLVREEAGHAETIAAKAAEEHGLHRSHQGVALSVSRGKSPKPSFDPFPDGPSLEAVLPWFDAATQTVAVAVIQQRMDISDVATALGVMRLTIERKLERFLRAARRLLVGGLVTATIAGFPGGLPLSHAMPGSAPLGLSEKNGAVVEHSTEAPHPANPFPVERESPPAGSVETAPAKQDGMSVQVLSHVATRMPKHDRSTHDRVARAVLAESAGSGVDPLLVLAMIHVESTFNPKALSDQGAAGLMQIRRPTMLEERKRSGLPPADPADPVVNIQVGVRYLARMITSFQEIDVALMAYNAGPTRIRGHLRRGEIPNRYQVYPKKVLAELSRLRNSFGLAVAVDPA